MQAVSRSVAFLVWLSCLPLAAAVAQDAAMNSEIFLYRGPDRGERLIERARQERTVVLYTSLAPTESQPLAQAFERKYGVKVELWRALSDRIVQRALNEAKARRHAVDVVETNGPEMEMMAREQLFGEFFSPHLADLPAGVVPAHRLWVPDRMTFFVVAYNTAKVRKPELPATYEGFVDPRWRGRLGLEATDAEWMAAIVRRWGPERGMPFFRRLAAMKPEVRKGHIVLAELVAAGEVEVGLTIYSSNAETLKRRGAPIDWLPLEPVIARPQGIAVARNAPHPHAALLFAEFVLSPEGQELLSAMGRVPVSTRVKHPLNDVSFTLIDPAIVLDEADQWNRLWDELFLKK